MTAIRHTGIYVNDIAALEKFYIACFDMVPIVSQEEDSNPLVDEIVGSCDALIETTKLVTPYGKAQGQGDMIELCKVLRPAKDAVAAQEGGDGAKYGGADNIKDEGVTGYGVQHIAFGIDDMDETVRRIEANGGSLVTRVTHMRNGALCCFAKDIEGNYIELIQRKH